MKVRLAPLSSRGASGSVDALAETSPVGAPGINATIFHSGSVTARLRIAGTTESKRLTMAEFSPSLCLGGNQLAAHRAGPETTAPLLRMVQQPPSVRTPISTWACACSGLNFTGGSMILDLIEAIRIIWALIEQWVI